MFARDKKILALIEQNVTKSTDDIQAFIKSSNVNELKKMKQYLPDLIKKCETEKWIVRDQTRNYVKQAFDLSYYDKVDQELLKIADNPQYDLAQFPMNTVKKPIQERASEFRKIHDRETKLQFLADSIPQELKKRCAPAKSFTR